MTKKRNLRSVPDTPPGAILYVRQSVTRRKKDASGKTTAELDTVSPELQESAGRAYCAQQGYPIVAIIQDLNRTGRTLARRKVQEAISLVEAGQASVIVVWKWSRLSRNRRDFAITCDRVEDLGGRIESSTEPIDTTTAMGRFNRGVLAEFAAFESDRIGEIIKEVQDNRVRQGLPGNGKPRFGYVNIDKRFYPDPDLGPVLREMYLRYIGGNGYLAIAAWLNDHGYRTTYGGHWRPTAVRSVLDSGFGAGLMQHRGHLMEGVHEPVITTDQWQRYLAAKEIRSYLPSRVKSSPYVLSGLVKCAICGNTMAARPDRYRKNWYRCKAKTLLRCPNAMVRVEAVEAEVLDWLREIVDDIDAATEVNERQQVRIDQASKKAETLRRQITDLDKALTAATVKNVQGLIPDDAYVAARDELTGKRARLMQELEQYESTTVATPRFDAAEYQGLLAEWDILPVEARREMLRRLLSRIRVWGRPVKVKPIPVWEEGNALPSDE